MKKKKSASGFDLWKCSWYSIQIKLELLSSCFCFFFILIKQYFFHSNEIVFFFNIIVSLKKKYKYASMYLFIFKKMLYNDTKIYLFSLYLPDIKQMSRHSFEFFFTELFQDLRQMQEAWLAEGISYTFYRADIFPPKTPIFWHFVCHNCCEKHVMFLGLIQTHLNMQCLLQKKKKKISRNKSVVMDAKLKMHVSSSLLQ